MNNNMYCAVQEVACLVIRTTKEFMANSVRVKIFLVNIILSALLFINTNFLLGVILFFLVHFITNIIFNREKESLMLNENIITVLPMLNRWRLG